MILYITGMLMLVEAALLMIPVLVALVYGDNTLPAFLLPAIFLAVCGISFSIVAKPRTKSLSSSDGMFMVAAGWVILSFFGGLPFYISDEIPSLIDATFEAVSGFTTTGATILNDVESLSHSVLFWRSFTHWLGGMGVLVFLMAILPLAGGSGNLKLMKAESPGPDVGKLVPKSRATAKILYSIYLALTVAEFISLLICRLGFFNSACMALGTAGTGGFGLLNDSCASYSPAVKIVLTVFMTLFGVNFNIYYLIICGKIRSALKSEELKAYFGIYFAAVFLIAVNIRSIYASAGETLITSFFQVSSVMTTTGFSTVDFNLWPEFCRVLMVIVMCIGGSAGSTAGGFKVARVMLLVKNARKELKSIAQPRAVNVVTFEGKRVSNEVIRNTNVYFLLYVLIFVASLFAVSFDKMDSISNITGVIATLNNIGPGLNVVGPAGNFAEYSVFSKLVFIADMLIGRLEIYPILLMLFPTFFKHTRPRAKAHLDEED